jgi:hypothetical protein
MTAMMWGAEFSGRKFVRPRRFLYELLPDMFPGGGLTKLEIALWGRFAEAHRD